MTETGPSSEVTQSLLDSLNVEQGRDENRANLDKLGGAEKLCVLIGVNPTSGLTHDQVTIQRKKFGDNTFPESPMSSYFELLLGALSDTTLLILIAAAAVSLVIGILSHPDNGWIEGTAIFIAVFLVSNISAGNDYTKQLQFKALEASSAEDERCSVLRAGTIERLNPKDLVVGDILVLQVGLFQYSPRFCSVLIAVHVFTFL
jgi:Ca2+-transporting ATPase